MSWIKQNKDAVAKKSLVLRKTKLITQDDIEINEGWEKLSQEYAKYKNGTWSEKAQVSLINAILYQQRAAFILTRANFREILQNDKNWAKPLGLKNENWSNFIYDSSELIGEVKKVQSGKGKVSIFCVKNQDILGLLCIDLKLQISEVEKFIESSHIDAGDQQGDADGDREEERELEREEKNNNPTFLKEEDIEIDLSFDSNEYVNNISSSLKAGDVAGPSLMTQKLTPIVSNSVVPSTSTPKQQITPEAILAKWKPSRVEAKEIENQVAELFTTLKATSRKW